jgi:hypothetical protein
LNQVTLHHFEITTMNTNPIPSRLSHLAALALALACTQPQAGVFVTRDAAAIAAFQSGLTVLNFEGTAPLGRTPQSINSYTAGQAVDSGAFLFNQAPAVQFSVGGTVGVNMPAIYKLTGVIGNDAASGDQVLGPVDFESGSNFTRNAFIEIYFPTKVSRVGFWLNQQLDFVTLLAANTNFAFTREDEVLLEQGIGEAGFFVGIERASADIGGLKVLSRGAEGFTIDDFSYGGSAAPVPEPGSLALMLAGLAAVMLVRRARAA